jgi:hypothetical protein
MRNFDAEAAVTVTELQQLVVDFGRDVDFNDARNMADFYAEDGLLVAGNASCRGRSAIGKFYADRNERVRSEQKDGVRTVRHAYTNVQIVIEGPQRAIVNFGSINYSGPGTPPLTGHVGPTLFSDCQMTLRREANGQWLITDFRASPVFVGNDPFLNRTMKI